MNKRGDKEEKNKNGFLYFILFSMLIFSLIMFYKSENNAVAAGSFGKNEGYRNVSFSDLSKKISLGGSFAKD